MLPKHYRFKTLKSHDAIWNWIQKHYHKRISPNRKKIVEFVVDETTTIKVGPRHIWLRVAIEPKKEKFSHYPHPKKETRLLLANFFNIVKGFGKHPAVYKNFPLLVDYMDHLLNYNKSIK